MSQTREYLDSLASEDCDSCDGCLRWKKRELLVPCVGLHCDNRICSACETARGLCWDCLEGKEL